MPSASRCTTASRSSISTRTTRAGKTLRAEMPVGSPRSRKTFSLCYAVNDALPGLQIGCAGDDEHESLGRGAAPVSRAREERSPRVGAHFDDRPVNDVLQGRCAGHRSEKLGRQHIARGSLGFDAPFAQNDGLVRERQCLAGVMRHVEHGNAALVANADQVGQDALLELRVERRKWLVEKSKRGFVSSARAIATRCASPTR